MIIRTMLLQDLFPADYNPRKALQAGDAEYDKLKRSIEQFGYVEPIIWNEQTKTVVGGHQRLTVLKDMGVTEVDVVVVSFDRTKEMALNVALNKISGEWDDAKLQALFQDLEGEGFDTSLTGFDAVEIEDLFKDTLKETMKQDGFDAGEALKEPPIAVAGDLWFLGEHRLLVAPYPNDFLMNGCKANLVVGDIQKQERLGSQFFTALADYIDDSASVYLFHTESSSLPIRILFEQAGFRLSTCCVWLCTEKPMVGATPYAEGHVPCLYGWKAKGKHEWYADRKQTTVWEIDGVADAGGLPIQVVGYPIVNSSMRNCIVLDPCAGAGAVIVACDQLQRICYGCEKDVAKASAAIKRYVELAGSDKVSVIRDGLTYGYSEVVK